jgi:hypothetical protein
MTTNILLYFKKLMLHNLGGGKSSTVFKWDESPFCLMLKSKEFSIYCPRRGMINVLVLEISPHDFLLDVA